jgi:hypothetical protein
MQDGANAVRVQSAGAQTDRRCDFFWVRSCYYVKSDSVHICTETVFIFQEILFWGRSCLYVKSDSAHICTETFFIFQEILRASLMPVHHCSSIVDLWPCHTLTGVGSRLGAVIWTGSVSSGHPNEPRADALMVTASHRSMFSLRDVWETDLARGTSFMQKSCLSWNYVRNEFSHNGRVTPE